MRHQVVTRLTVLLAVLVLLAASAFVWVVRDAADVPAAAPPAAEGAALFDRHCTPCHAAPDLGRRLQDDAAVRREWAALLEHHGKASDEEDRLILDYLAGSR